VTRSPSPCAALLQTFVDGRRGLRLGTLFGAPAVFAGRRAAIRVVDDAFALRLAPAGRDLAWTLCRDLVRGPQGAWLQLSRPSHPRGQAACLTLFEHAVRDVATA
jgi:hypothetical protein